MKKFLLKNMFWINLIFLTLPISFVIPAMQELEESRPIIFISLLLVIGVTNFLVIMLIVFILNGMYGKGIAIASFVAWVVIASQGTLGLLAAVFITVSYWIFQKRFVDRYGSETISTN